jgi:hypothetical protein
MVADKKIIENTALVFKQKMKKQKSMNPHTIRYKATTALNSFDAMPAVESPVAEYGAPSCSVGSCSIPNESQNTAKRPHTIMLKKFPMIHSKTTVRSNSTGPVKKKIPLAVSS